MLYGFFRTKITVFFIFIKQTMTDDILYVFTIFSCIFVCSSIIYRILIAITTFFNFLQINHTELYLKKMQKRLEQSGVLFDKKYCSMPLEYKKRPHFNVVTNQILLSASCNQMPYFAISFSSIVIKIFLYSSIPVTYF